MPLHSLHCSACELQDEEIIKFCDLEAFDAKAALGCPLCGSVGTYRRVITKAPMMRMSGEGSDRQIVDMKRSFQNKFWKGGGADDVRHKHPEAFSDSLRGAAVSKIKEKLGKQ